jgi:cell division protein FtsI/penicillin-binding protein 2
MVGGKTGTAQLLEEDGTYSDDLEVGSFIGYVGSSHPEYVIMTRVSEPGIPGYAGSVAAAPMFADISNWLIDHQDMVPR